LGIEIELASPRGPILLRIKEDQAGSPPAAEQLQIIRAGEFLYGNGPASPIAGWFSPTYGVKIPALAVRFSVTSPLPIRFTSGFTFLSVDNEAKR
jgi:hypothetical protein